jgi:hypothetical protein
MGVTLPAILVVFACKTFIAVPTDDNARFTHWEGRDWETVNSMMVCQRHEIELYDPAEYGGYARNGDFLPPADPLGPNFSDFGQCARAAMKMQMDWDQRHQNTKWRVWRVGCPTPIAADKDANGEPDLDEHGQPIIIGYKLPECGHRDTVICETDSEI